MRRIKAVLPPVLTGLAAALVILTLGRSLFLFLDYMITLIVFPFNVDYGEGPILDQVMHLAKFQSIYPRELSELPFAIGNYPPFYHLLQVPFAWIFGPAYWYGRLINLLSILVTAVLIGLVVHKLTQNRLAAVTGGMLLPAIPFILHWSGFVRVDAFALAASWAGITAVVHWPEQRRGKIMAAVPDAAILLANPMGWQHRWLHLFGCSVESRDGEQSSWGCGRWVFGGIVHPD
jgi:hypothetical protein